MGRTGSVSRLATWELTASVLKGLPDLVLVLDRELRVLLAGGGTAGHTDVPEEFAGQRLGDVFADPDATLIPGCRAAADGHPVSFEYRQSEDGRAFRCHAAPREEGSEIVGAVVSVQEIAETREAALAVANERKLFRKAFSAASIGMAMTTLDGTILRVNARLLEMTGYSEDALVGRRLQELGDPEGLPIDDEALARLAAVELDDYAHEGRYMRADGTTFSGSLRLARVADEYERPLLFVAHLADVTAGDATRRALRDLSERFKSAFENAPLGMALVSKAGKPFQVNRALTEITGHTRAELLAMSPLDVVHPDDVTGAVVKLCEELLAGEVESLHSEMRWFDNDGHVVWVSLNVSTVRGADQRADYFVVQVTDISERRRIHDRMEHLADHDGLTGLLNRRRFEAELAQSLARVQRYGEEATLLLIDLDGFKHVNDAFGHAVGDKLLVHISSLLKERLRETDVVGRLGGDEFAILLPHVSPRHADEVAADLTAQIRSRPMTHRDERIACSASIGVAVLDESVASTEDLLVAADLGMYRAKAASRGEVPADPG